MIRKTITIDDNLYKSISSDDILKNFSSFSEMVSNALKLLLEKQRKEQYKKDMLEASKDPLYLQDIKEISEDFRYIDREFVETV